jgi:hypothetical protein
MGSDRPGGERKPMGAGNRCALFGRTYLELLGLFGDGSVDPWRIRPLIAEYEGLHGCSFGCGDAETVERRLRAAGLSSSGVLPLQPDVPTPDGPVTARARGGDRSDALLIGLPPQRIRIDAKSCVTDR